jgi:hypothetical protein
MNPTAFVDLTTTTPGDHSEISGLRAPYMYSSPDRSTHFSQSSQAARSPRRRQLDNGSSARPSSSHISHSLHRQFAEARNGSGGVIESVDLTEVNDPSALFKALSKQREDAVKAQMAKDAETGRSALTAYKCPVCMDTAVDATSTICGMYCVTFQTSYIRFRNLCSAPTFFLLQFSANLS